MEATRTAQIDPKEAALRDAKAFYEWALRHGNAGDCSRGRRFIREATKALEVS